MGLFSGEVKTYVGTSVSRVLEDNMIVPSIKTGATKGIIKKGRIDEYVIEDVIRGLGIRGKSFYRYGAQQYDVGLPKSTVTTPVSGSSQVQTILEDIEGATVLLVYSFFGYLNYLHVARSAINDTYSYNLGTNELEDLSAIKGWPVYLTQTKLTVPLSKLQTIPLEALQTFGEHVEIVSTELSETIALAVTYEWTVEIEDPFTHEITYVLNTESATVTSDLTIPAFDKHSDYVHANYTVGGVSKYWTYRIGEGTYPTLDTLNITEYTESGTYFPWVYFRYGATAGNANPLDPVYIQTRKLCKKLAIDYDDLVDSIHENPDIADVQQAMLYMAVPAVSTNQLECEYLFKYFSEAFVTQGGQLTTDSREEFEASLTKNDLSPVTNVFRDSRFTMSLGHWGIWKRLVTGVIGSVGFYKSETDTMTFTVTYVNEDESILNVDRTAAVHYYMRQVSETEYEEIQVMDLRLAYYVYGNHMTVGSAEDSQDILLIPLDMAIMDTFGLIDQEALYARSMHYVFNSMVQVKVKWYETGFFKFVMIVVAVVITIVTSGATIKELLVSIGTGTASASSVITSLIMIGFTEYVTSEVFKLIVKAIGIENAAILALLLVFKGAYAKFTGGSLGVPIINAKGAINLATNLIKATNAVVADTIKDLNKEMQEFSEYTTDMFNHLKEVEDSLTTHSVLAPELLLGESAEDFINRTIHGGNIGMLAIQQISTYVENMLKLPTFKDTLGGLPT